MSQQIFLSYRRNNGSEKARLLKLFLEKCGYTVFMDQDKINTSMPFTSELERKVDNCTDFILLVTEDSLTYRPDGTDFLYEEMLRAYNRYKNRGTNSAPVLHVVAESEIKTAEFGGAYAIEVPNKYAEALDFFCKLTPLPVAHFVGRDEVIYNNIKTIMSNALAAQPSVRLAEEPSSQSGYTVNDTEIRRLTRQGESTYEQDALTLKHIFSVFRAQRRTKLTVLDVGCANGKTGKRYFGDNPQVAKVVGIDMNPNLICKAMEEEQTRPRTSKGPKFVYNQVDLSDGDFDGVISGIKAANNIDNFDIIFCCQVLHHVANPQEVMQKLSMHLKPGGCFIVRASDDDSKMIYCPGFPEENVRLLSEIIDLTVSLKTMADRFYGRKLFSELESLQLTDVEVVPVTTASSRVPEGKRHAFLIGSFNESFSWRYEIFQDKDGVTPTEYIPSEQKMKAKLDKLKEMFENRNCWYSVTDYFGYGFKK